MVDQAQLVAFDSNAKRLIYIYVCVCLCVDRCFLLFWSPRLYSPHQALMNRSRRSRTTTCGSRWWKTAILEGCSGGGGRTSTSFTSITESRHSCVPKAVSFLFLENRAHDAMRCDTIRYDRCQRGLFDVCVCARRAARICTSSGRACVTSTGSSRARILDSTALSPRTSTGFRFSSIALLCARPLRGKQAQ